MKSEIALALERKADGKNMREEKRGLGGNKGEGMRRRKSIGRNKKKIN
jgi:hypothetical protein